MTCCEGKLSQVRGVLLCGSAGGGALPVAVGGGEIRQRLTAEIMALRKENLLVSAVKGAPSRDATFERAADAVGQAVRAEFILEVLENRHRHDAGIQSISRTLRQTSVSGSARVRQVRGCFFWDGKRASLSMRRAVHALKPALAAAASWFRCRERADLIHNAHLPVGLERQDFLLRIARRRTSGFTRRRDLSDGVGIDVRSADHPRRALAQMGRREKFLGDQPLNGRRTDAKTLRRLIKGQLASFLAFAFAIHGDLPMLPHRVDARTCPAVAFAGGLARAVQKRGDRLIGHEASEARHHFGNVSIDGPTVLARSIAHDPERGMVAAAPSHDERDRIFLEPYDDLLNQRANDLLAGRHRDARTVPRAFDIMPEIDQALSLDNAERRLRTAR